MEVQGIQWNQQELWSQLADKSNLWAIRVGHFRSTSSNPSESWVFLTWNQDNLLTLPLFQYGLSLVKLTLKFNCLCHGIGKRDLWEMIKSLTGMMLSSENEWVLAVRNGLVTKCYQVKLSLVFCSSTWPTCCPATFLLGYYAAWGPFQMQLPDLGLPASRTLS